MSERMSGLSLYLPFGYLPELPPLSCIISHILAAYGRIVETNLWQSITPLHHVPYPCGTHPSPALLGNRFPSFSITGCLNRRYLNPDSSSPLSRTSCMLFISFGKKGRVEMSTKLHLNIIASLPSYILH